MAKAALSIFIIKFNFYFSGASFKNIKQVIQATEAGSHYVTVGSEVINSFTLDNNVKNAVQKFETD